MRKSIPIVLLAALVAVVSAALLCSCSGCSNKTVGAPAEVQGTAAVQAKPEAAVEKETAPEVQSAEAAQVAEETPAEAVAEETAVEPVGEEESAPVEEESAPGEVASTEEPAEELVVEKAPAQEAEPVAAEPEPAPTAAEPAAETAEEPAEEPVVAAVAEEPESEESASSEKNCGSHILTLGLSPWGWQHFHIDESGIDDKNSTYGLGGKLAYTYLFDSGFYVGAEAAYETYFIDHKDNFHDIMFFVDGGYNFSLSEKLGLYAGLGGGMELECYDCECSSAGIFKADLGMGYSISEHFILGAGCDFVLGVPVKNSEDYLGFQIVPCITVSYRF